MSELSGEEGVKEHQMLNEIIKEEKEEEKKNYRENIFLLFGVGLIFFTWLIDKLYTTNSFDTFIQKIYQSKLDNLTIEEIQSHFDNSIHTYQKEMDSMSSTILNFLKSTSNSFNAESFIHKRFKEIEDDPNHSLLNLKPNQFNIIVLSRIKNDLVNSILNLHKHTDIHYDYSNFNSFSKSHPLCSFLNFYDLQDIGFITSADGDFLDIKKTLQRQEFINDPNKLIHSLWYVIDETKFLPNEIDVIQELVNFFSERKIKILLIIRTNPKEDTKDNSGEGRNIFNRLSQVFKDNIKVKIVLQHNNNMKEFNEKLLKQTFMGMNEIQEIYEDAYTQAVFGSIITQFTKYVDNIEITNDNKFEPVFNSFIGRVTEYFGINPSSLDPREITDFYFKTLLFENVNQFNMNWTQCICLYFYKRECENQTKEYNQIDLFIKGKLSKDDSIINLIRLNIFKRFKDDIIKSIIVLLKEKRKDFFKPITTQILPKLININHEVHRQAKFCLNEMGYE